jgi:hypothetical protein
MANGEWQSLTAKDAKGNNNKIEGNEKRLTIST